ncbi:Hypothetical protein PBC10988_36240 [Planctomycetales bacterium 10988]|nr:Hypothetical protein PBC10988_36240 [Planctomycetales bacterium 10988]
MNLTQLYDCNSQNRWRCRVSLTFAFVGTMLLAASPALAQQAPEELEKQYTFYPLPTEEIGPRLENWLESQPLAEPARQQARKVWEALAEESDASARLKQLVLSVAQVNAEVESVYQLCMQPRQSIILPDLTWLQEQDAKDFVWGNVRLFVGQWLARHRYYDHSSLMLEGISHDQLIDPASFFFSEAVCFQQLIKQKEALAAIDRLLEETAACPERYRQVAMLMKEDISKLEEESLDHIARQMADSQRRLELAQATPEIDVTQQVQDNIVNSLEQIIKKLEEQQQQQAGGAAPGSANGNRSLQPANESTPAGGGGPGEVGPRDLKPGEQWGELPPKERERAIQQAAKNFPSHYREVIEQYFRKIASEPARDE